MGEAIVNLGINGDENEELPEVNVSTGKTRVISWYYSDAVVFGTSGDHV